MLSLNPAKLLHKDKELGSIAIGKRADLLIFDESIDMKYVFVDGDLRYKK